MGEKKDTESTLWSGARWALLWQGGSIASELRPVLARTMAVLPLSIYKLECRENWGSISHDSSLWAAGARTVPAGKPEPLPSNVAIMPIRGPSRLMPQGTVGWFRLSQISCSLGGTLGPGARRCLEAPRAASQVGASNLRPGLLGRLPCGINGAW